MQKTLDLSIKNHEHGTTHNGYITANKKIYPAYMNNQAWEAFVADMMEHHNDAYREYGAGSGGELKEKGNYPPKMASYGSSSRMIYALSKGETGFHFEYQLPTVVGGTANLDGYLEKENELIFVEAKCREPYGSKPHLIEDAYRALYEYLTDDQGCDLNISTEDADDKKMNVTFSVDGLPITRFDIKQMICHLLGIAAKLLERPTDKKITFLYLCYDPHYIEIADEKKAKKILAAYDQMRAECEAIDFTKLWESIVTYLRVKLDVGTATDREVASMLANFRFTLCDQEVYQDLLK
jgi:hypothetical protein